MSAAVGILRAGNKTRAQSGMANAVLRKATGGIEKAWAALPPDRLPKWLRNSLVPSWGEDIVAAIEAAHALRPPVDLTPGPRMTAEIEAALAARRTPTGSLRLS